MHKCRRMFRKMLWGPLHVARMLSTRHMFSSSPAKKPQRVICPLHKVIQPRLSGQSSSPAACPECCSHSLDRCLLKDIITWNYKDSLLFEHVFIMKMLIWIKILTFLWKLCLDRCWCVLKSLGADLSKPQSFSLVVGLWLWLKVVFRFWAKTHCCVLGLQSGSHVCDTSTMAVDNMF